MGTIMTAAPLTLPEVVCFVQHQQSSAVIMPAHNVVTVSSVYLQDSKDRERANSTYPCCEVNHFKQARTCYTHALASLQC